MNLGDGLLFELENGKPKLILLSHGIEKNPTKLSCRPRAANILSSRQPSCVEEVQGEQRPARQQAGRHKETKSKAGGATASNTANTGRKSTTLTSSKTNELKGGSIKVEAKVKSDRQKHSTAVSSLRANGKTGQPQNTGTRAGGKVKDTLTSGDTGQKDSVVCLTSEQLQKILNTVQTTSNGQDPPEDHRTQNGNQIDSNSGSSMGEGGGKEKERGGGTDTTGSSQDKDSRLSGCLFSWLEERQSESRAAIDAKKAQWRRELDEQVALKQQQQRSAPGRLQAEEDTESVLSVQSSVSHRELPAAVRSSLRLGEIAPMEDVLNVERKEEEKRRWLEELDHQREEATERRRREKVLQRQTEDHELWAIHFDSLQRRPPVQIAAPSAPPPAPSNGSERGEWEPTSSLSLVWEAMSSCGAESIGGASVDMTSGYPTRASHLRTMTALLDPAQIEERERRRLKQLEQQRAIEAQVEERRRLREQEQARRREEEAEEERRVALERQMLERRYELDALKERQKEQQSHQAEQPNKDHHDDRHQEILEPRADLTTDESAAPQPPHNCTPPRPSEEEPGPSQVEGGRSVEAEEEGKESNSDDEDERCMVEEDRQSHKKDDPAVTRQGECLEEGSSSASTYRDTAVQTEAAGRVQTPHISAQYQPPPPLSAAPPPNSRTRVLRTGKENICLPGGGGGGGGGDLYEAFARTERNRKDKRRPEWNTQRPSRQFIPASARYPASLQRNRQENRMKRQAELLALQERTCLSRPNPPPLLPPSLPQNLCSNPTQTRTSPTRKVESVSRGHDLSTAINSERGRSPPVPAVRHRVQSQQAPPSSTSPPPPILEFIPYVRTDEVFNLDPLEPADTPPPHIHTAPPDPSHRDPLLHPELLRNKHTPRQQEILRGLAQLRQGLLQKQRELETDLNPLLKRHDNVLR